MVVHSGVVPGLLFLSWAGCRCTPLFFVNLVHFLHFIRKKACKTQRGEAE